ncbi:YdeI/OmpD-associated family protein [Streptomyces sp. NPDC007164]|uniref:YdeI/OmpD-associated family protein n=1 Tax=Streptomyces sp. NPDC007164 TaxID=3156918 RepID=UPI0033F8756D
MAAAVSRSAGHSAHSCARKPPSSEQQRSRSRRGEHEPDGGAREAAEVRRAHADPGARKAFEALNRSGRYQLILPLLQALTPETRKARLDKALHRLVHDGPAE